MRVFLRLDTEAAEARERRAAVGARRVPTQVRTAIGDARQERVAMRDRFIAGDAQAPQHTPCRSDRGSCERRHAEILS